jgi:ABC-2 type transport system permease protein
VTALARAAGRPGFEELPKLAAFLRRDALTAWSYRVSFFSEWAQLGFQALLFYMLGRVVNPSSLPVYGGTRATYMEFVAVGIALSVFTSVAVARIAAQIRNEQLAGTLEALLLTPTSPVTVQLGSVAYDLLYVPVRTGIFLLIVALGFGLRFHATGIPAAAAVLLVFLPFAWGLGVTSAAATLTVRRGTSAVAVVLTLMTVGSGSYFPVAVLPAWVRPIADENPLTLAVSGVRRALLAGMSPAEVARTVGLLAVWSAGAVAVGAVAFALALRRERRRGTLGQY